MRPSDLPAGSSRPGLSSSRWHAELTDQDNMRWLSCLALGGLCLATVLALFGGVGFDVPMPTHRFGVVDPSCGLTRGSTAIARGDLILAWRYNPLSFVVMGSGVFGVLRMVVGLLSGRWLDLRLRLRARDWMMVGGALVVLWVYQQQHAEFIINARL